MGLICALMTLQPLIGISQETTEIGLAAKHPGDVGMGKDPAVIFADDFETGDLKRWDELKGKPIIVEVAPHAGKKCVQMEMVRGQNTGCDAKKWFMPGADKVYARFYVKFSPDYQYNHHFVWLLANDRKNRWSAFGKAGQKPDGTWFCSGIEPSFAWGKNPPPGEVTFYSYYLDMDIDPKMNKYWGNSFYPPGPGKGQSASPSRVIPPLNQWQCWEFMVEANSTADKADGRQTMWIDGRKVGDFTGIRWRLGTDLKINCFWLEHYGYDNGDPTKRYWKERQSVWFDDVVVARQYIGPITSVKQ
jgi:hypothetical protein